MKVRRGRGARLAALGAVLALAIAGCSSEGGAQEEAPAAGGGGGQVAQTERLSIAMITHEAPGDTFWDKIRSGAEAAAAKDNVDLRYSNENAGPEQATLIQNAVDSGVDGIAVTMAFTEAVRPAIQAAVDAGIPVVAFNQGFEQWEEYGALMYFGSDEALAGQTVGERLTELGAGKAICIIQEQGSVALETRCQGVAQGFPNTENLQVTGTDLPSVRSTIAAKLQQDPAVTHIVTLGAPFALAALESINDAGSEAQVATFDLNEDAVAAIQDGSILFSVDQQPWLQGYMAVDSLWFYLTNANVLGGGLPVLTGPSIVDSENIERIAEYAAAGTR